LGVNFFGRFTACGLLPIDLQVSRQCMFQSGYIGAFGILGFPSFQIPGIHSVSNRRTRKRSGLMQVP